ncbi:hypothetical protein [Chamaesiphon polymorphus]|uniref:Uncharacterized protein n=1 Tax=Chamaesiphon polymorphus CCALA 037 TaxID=2107692 RepID=A0A2T1GC41_9CYAN|nr:hypothetical protein [Chamaesiphon polymorphus]PSB54924.1 hypothetical protein C7B77_16670 [Chamaesiphon polymorphus CCALA 037]
MKLNSLLILGAISALLLPVTHPLPGQSTPIQLAQLSISPIDEKSSLQLRLVMAMVLHSQHHPRKAN